MTFLICGLQMRFHIFNRRQRSLTLISRWFGNTLLGFAGNMVMFTISSALPALSPLFYVESVIDLILISSLGFCTYIIFANRPPSTKVKILIISPYVLIAVLSILFPAFDEYNYDAAILTLLGEYLLFIKILYNRNIKSEATCEEPEARPLRWLNIAAVICLVWWGGFSFCLHLDAVEYYYIVGCSIASVLIFYISIKISNIAEPSCFETSSQNERGNGITASKTRLVRVAIEQLYGQQQIYTNPDLTIEDVANALRVTPRQLSWFFDKEMDTSFNTFTNEYRINHAKELMVNSDEKMTIVAYRSGFNSSQVMTRTFVRMTGETPGEWRVKGK